MLERQDSWKLPLEEVSALGLRRDAETGRVQVLAVDDERYAVAVAAVAHGDIAPPDVEAAISSGAGEDGRGSDFEGVASEAGGRVFVLQEGADRVRVLSPDLRKAPRTIALSVPRDERDFGEEWHADDNARGEGLLLLRNGHLLVAKQRKEPRLIEFGPADHEPGGFRPGHAIQIDESFPLPAGETVPFTVLASWPLDADTELESINDLAIDADGRLHAVSSKSRCLARLDAELDPRGGTAALPLGRFPTTSSPVTTTRPRASASGRRSAGSSPSTSSATRRTSSRSPASQTDAPGRCQHRHNLPLEPSFTASVAHLDARRLERLEHMQHGGPEGHAIRLATRLPRRIPHAERRARQRAGPRLVLSREAPPSRARRRPVMVSERSTFDGGRYSWMRSVLATEHGRRAYRKRKQTVEPLFGNTNTTAASTASTGGAGVRTEWRLLMMTQNLGKLHRHRLAAVWA